MKNKTEEGKPKMVRAIRKTGKTINGYTVYESINPETRKLMATMAKTGLRSTEAFKSVPSLADLEGGTTNE